MKSNTTSWRLLTETILTFFVHFAKLEQLQVDAFLWRFDAPRKIGKSRENSGNHRENSGNHLQLWHKTCLQFKRPYRIIGCLHLSQTCKIGSITCKKKFRWNFGKSQEKSQEKSGNLWNIPFKVGEWSHFKVCTTLLDPGPWLKVVKAGTSKVEISVSML